MRSTCFSQHRQAAFVCFIAICASVPAAAQYDLRVSHLTTEHQEAPLAVDVPHPRMSWRLESNAGDVLQTGYRIIVASSSELASKGQGDVWDSGDVGSADSIDIPYSGPSLFASTRYYWAVRVKDNGHRISKWSAPSWWEMGLLDPKDWSGAKWIAGVAGEGSPLLRTRLDVVKPILRARLFISAGGYYVASINGHRLGDAVLDPGFTDYKKRNLYQTYDVLPEVHAGANVIGVTLGRGFFALDTQNTFWWQHVPWLSESPELLAKLDITYTDGSHTVVITSPEWQTHAGPTRSNSMFRGESYDARMLPRGWDTPAYETASWQQARLANAPSSVLQAEGNEPIRVVKTWKAVTITQPKPGVYVYKFPVMVAGWTRLAVSGKAGTTVTLRLGEQIDAAGTVVNQGDPHMSPGEIQRYEYTLSGRGLEVWQPAFSYAGFQYAQVENFPGTPTIDSVEAEEVHSDVPAIGKLSTSNKLLNQIHDLCRQSVLNNLYSIPTDTPVFEKRGWTGDALLFSAQAADNFDVDRFFTKWMYDVADSQNQENDIANIAPGIRQGSDPAWGSAAIFIPWRLYLEYGDAGPIVQHYDTMKRYMGFLAGKAKNHLVNGSFGDWVSPSLTRGPAPPEGAELVDSAVYFRDAQLMAKMAGLLDRKEDEAAFSNLAAEIKEAFNASFLDSSTGAYHTGKAAGYRQTSNAVPLYFGMTPPDRVALVMTGLDRDIAQRHDHLDTGAFGTAALLPALTENGEVDLAYRIATQTTFPSWGNMIASGATATLERWDPDPKTSRSRDHAFLGTVDDWLYKYIAGIQPAEPGYKVIEIKPYLPAGLDHAEASIDTPYGLVSSSWKRQAHGECILEVEIPVNTTALIWVPGAASPVHAGSGLHRYTSQVVGRSL